ncbi:MAG: histidine triad nucleotide-binding protein [Oscillospiraceae bacterium]|nr:histidine triad nucleotide-binding protein [Oscillospiraceae bacterium]
MSMVINADSDCLFCNIIEGKIPSTKVYEDDYCYAFRDIAPQAPTHILVIPKEHIPSADALDEGNSSVAARCLEAIPKIARAEGLENGYRIISNVGPDAGQSVKHLHFHLLGGKRLPDQMV